MASDSRREVILGVGGGIAAYKSCDLLRRLQDDGYLVTVVPTPASLNFVGKATWEALSGRPVQSEVWENVHLVPHIELAARADYILIAPATADLISRLAHGRADDLLTNIVLASDSPKLIVPAMHPQMWLDPATIANVETLKSRNFHLMDPDFGRLTGSDSGAGRFPTSARILLEFAKITERNADLRGVKILVTAGGTREAIDPVRYIGNRSSGIQGYAIAEAAAARGAKVQLISANCHLADIPGVEIIKVESTAQLSQALSLAFPATDVLIMVAAVSDARPKEISFEKIKKEELASLELIKNPDLLASLAKVKRSGQVMMGFAAETVNPEINARKKLADKGLDFLYLNDVSQGAIFGSPLTEGVILKKIGEPLLVPSCSKRELADLLLDQLALQLR